MQGNIPTKTKGRLLFILEGVTVTTRRQPKGGYLDFPQKRGTKGAFRFTFPVHLNLLREIGNSTRVKTTQLGTTGTSRCQVSGTYSH
jgi:hypothetical protein